MKYCFPNFWTRDLLLCSEESKLMNYVSNDYGLDCFYLLLSSCPAYMEKRLVDSRAWFKIELALDMSSDRSWKLSRSHA